MSCGTEGMIPANVAVFGPAFRAPLGTRARPLAAMAAVDRPHSTTNSMSFSKGSPATGAVLIHRDSRSKNPMASSEEFWK